MRPPETEFRLDIRNFFVEFCMDSTIIILEPIFERMDSSMDQQALFDFTYGLFVLSSAYDGKASGCIINTAGQVTDTPAQVTVAVNKTGYTCSLIEQSGIFNLSILDEDADFEIFRHFGFQSGRDVDKFSDYEHCAKTENGLYYVTRGTDAVISCTVTQKVDLGTHMLFVATVDEARVLSDVPSASYTYYHEHIKPKREEKKEGRIAWKCKICGYIYDHEDLPADFICPWCKHPASDFEKIYV